MNTGKQAAGSSRKSNLVRSFRLCTSEGLVAMPIVLITQPVNVVLAALFTKVLHLPNNTIGVISALPFLCNFFQVGISPLLARWFSAKDISMVGSCLHTLAWTAFCVMLGFLPENDPAAAGLWIGLWFFVSSFCASITGVSWNAWVQEWVPARLRGKYFGRRNRLLQFSSLSFLLLAGWVLATWSYSRTAFQLVVAFAVTLRLLSILWQIRMPTESTAKPLASEMSISGQFQLLRQNQPYLRFIVFGTVWSFASNLFGPFYHVFMFQELNLSALQVGILSVCGASGAALTMPAWGALLDRFGNKGVMAVSFGLWQLSNFLWCFLTPSNTDWLYFMWLWGGATNAGFFLGMFTLMLKLLPVPARNLALGVNLAVTSLFAAIAPVLGGALLEHFISANASLVVYHSAFVFQPVAALLVVWLLLRIREPAASPLTHVVGAMSNVRTLASLSGLSFLANYIYYKNPRR
ncbi:MFS transporter [Verrucomicrobia bacterium IMCC26134]|jgi:MFS family permease|nr:MFS transporter [Verrucomicrobia bacterium IMCC26134]